MSKKIVLAYSGGLDTSVIIPWLKDNYEDCEVIAMIADVGQGDNLDEIKERAIKSGASKVYIENLIDEFVNDFIVPTLKSGASYEDYLLGTALSRPIIAKKLVEIAKKENAYAVCHGSTGKGNDQVRFELTVKYFAPEIKIIAPWRLWNLKSRDDELKYAKEKNIPIKVTKETSYSKDKNLWHLSHEGLDLENIANEPMYEKQNFLELSISPVLAKDSPTYITIEFEKGIPVVLNSNKMSVRDIIFELNKIAGSNGIGLLDIVENRLVGMKCRGVYETPAGTVLQFAHKYLETICLDKLTAHKKQELSIIYADLIYNGFWFSPLRNALAAFVDETQKNITGSVKLKLYKGNIIKAGVSSNYSLYSENLVAFGEGETYNHLDAEGFINLYGLPLKILGQLKEKVE